MDYLLDNSYFGRQIYGIRAAAHVHFETTTADLTVTQSAQLAALLKAPSSLIRVQDKWNARTRKVLKVMHEQDFITQKQLFAALNEL